MSGGARSGILLVMKNVLVTGATGVIGRRLVHELLENGYQVRVLVRDPERAVDAMPARWVEGVQLVDGDVTDAASLEPALKGVDGVLHLAVENVDGTRNLLDAAARAGVRNIVSAGTTIPRVEDVAHGLRLAYEWGHGGELPRWMHKVVPLFTPLAGKSVAEVRELVRVGHRVTRFFSVRRAVGVAQTVG